MSATLDNIRLIAEGLDFNINHRSECPWCARRDSFTITRTESGILYNCYRDSCRQAHHSHGFLAYDKIFRGKRKRKQDKPARIFTDDTIPLPPAEAGWLQAKYAIDPSAVYKHGVMWCPNMQRYAIPVYSLHLLEIGMNLRQGAHIDKYPKSLLYKHNPDQPFCSWHYDTAPHPGVPIVLVEDQWSAIRVAMAGYVGVALLGTHLSDDVARHLASVWCSEVVIALDNDATATAIKHVRRYSLLFKALRYVVLDKDLKDLPDNQAITEALHLC